VVFYSLNALRKLGKVLHLTPSNNLILRAKVDINAIGATVVSSLSDKVGIIHDVFGPVAMPYVSVKPLVKDPSKFVGKFLYLLEE